ncbi:cyclic nucleotide-binding domain-containing protein [Spirosoma arcticum]
MLRPLINHFESYLPFEERKKQLLEGRVTERKLKRRQAILQEGFPCQHYSFFVEGCFRMYGVDPKGTEHTIQSTIIATYQMIQNSQLCIVPKVGHTVFLENFPAVWTGMVPFLNP